MNLSLKELQREFKSILLTSSISEKDLEPFSFDNREGRNTKRRMDVYHRAYRSRIKKSLQQDFPWTIKAVSRLNVEIETFLEDFINKYPSVFWTLSEVSLPFPQFIAERFGNNSSWLKDLSLFEWNLILSGEAGYFNKTNDMLSFNSSLIFQETDWRIHTRNHSKNPIPQKTFLVIFAVNSKIRWEEMEKKFFHFLKDLYQDVALTDAVEIHSLTDDELFQTISAWTQLGIIRGLIDKDTNT